MPDRAMSDRALPASDPLDQVRDALDRGDWTMADELLDVAGDRAGSAAGLELRARAAYGDGRFEDCVSAWERLHELQVAADERPAAALAAAMIAMYLMMDTGLMAPVRGWLQRAERLLGESDGSSDPVPAHAVIAMVRTYERLMCGDMDAARVHSARAIDLGDRLGVQPAVVIGRVAAARVRIFDGHIEEGLDLLDEIGIMLMSGSVDPLTTGMMYCELICAAQGLALHDRAHEWTEVMEHWRHGVAFGGINGRCRVHRAEMFRMTGPCDRAEEEALRACEELRPWMRREFGWPLVELGNIRLRKGDLDGADEAYRAAHDHAWSPQPGWALVHLARGEIARAAELIADAIEHPVDIPSKERPPFGDLRVAPLLDAQVEIAAAAGDVATARRAADALTQIADRYPSRSIGAAAALARARVALLAGDHDAAIAAASEAVSTWAALGAPFETAVARTVLGRSLTSSGHPERARMEWSAAVDAFRAFGADRWARTAADELPADELPADVPPPDAPPTDAPPTATFRCRGDTRTVHFGDATALVHDLKGFRYIARLLAEPGREFHVLDLIAVDRGTLPDPRDRSDVDDGASVGPADAGLPVLDDRAREAYRRRLAEVDDDIDDATRRNDLGRLELARRDREYLVAELTRAVGLGGRHRRTGGSTERARTSVTRAIRYGLGRLRDHHPVIATHLSQNVHTGTYCVYRPDPFAPITWDV